MLTEQASEGIVGKTLRAMRFPRSKDKEHSTTTKAVTVWMEVGREWEVVTRPRERERKAQSGSLGKLQNDYLR